MSIITDKITKIKESLIVEDGVIKDKDGNVVSSGGIIQTKYDSTNATTSTTSQNGFVALQVDLNSMSKTDNNLLIIGNVFGAAGDDSHAWLEYKIGDGDWTRDSILNGDKNGGAAFGDFSSVRDQEEADSPVHSSTSILWNPNSIEPISIRIICSAENDTDGGFHLNVGKSGDTASSYNNTTMKSSLLVQEIGY